MEYTAMDARAYRGLNADQYEQRRSMVLSLADSLPEDATEEQIRSIDAELGIIRAEDSRLSRAAMTVRTGMGRESRRSLSLAR